MNELQGGGRGMRHLAAEDQKTTERPCRYYHWNQLLYGVEETVPVRTHRSYTEWHDREMDVKDAGIVQA